MAEVFTKPPNVRFQHSELLLERFASQFPHNTEVELRLAKIRRRLGHSRASQLALSSAKTEAEILVRANVEFDLGNYRDSVDAFKAATLSTTDNFKKLIDTAFVNSLQGQGEAGTLLNERVSLGATALALSGDSTTSQPRTRCVSRRRRTRKLIISEGFDLALYVQSNRPFAKTAIPSATHRR